jgi:hypothetical protein
MRAQQLEVSKIATHRGVFRETVVRIPSAILFRWVFADSRHSGHEMKTVFLLLWGLISLLLAGAALRELWVEPSLAGSFAFLLILYCSFCFFQLIRAAYRPWGLLGPRRTAGYWVCLLMVPLALFPLRMAHDIWEAGAYRLDVNAQESRLSLLVFRQLLAWLQDLVGYIGPMLVLVLIGLGMALLLLRLSRGQVVR